MAARASSSTSSLLPRAFSPALSSLRHRHCLFFPLCNSRSTIQARVQLHATDSQHGAGNSPMDLSTQFPASLIDCLQDEQQIVSPSQTQYSSKEGLRLIYSVSPVPLLAIAALPGAGPVAELFEPIAEVVRSLDLPDWLVHWGHPGNMAVVLFAMGGYGSYLGWQIRLADDLEVKAKAKDLHPKLLGGMFFFFSLGATGGILSLLTSGRPIFDSPHALTGLSGLVLLTVQTALTGFFESNPSLRGVHGVLGSGIMLLFLVHAAFGLQLGLSY